MSTSEHDIVAIPDELPIEVKPGAAAVVTTTAEPVLPTQVAHPWRASFRSFFQALIALVPLLNGVAIAVAGAFTDSGVAFPDWAWAIVNGVVVITAFGTMLVTRVMNVPGVTTWIEKWLPALAPTPVKKDHNNV